MVRENIYRTVTCGELRESNIGDTVRVAGWVENIRDHGGVMFLDIRDHYGVLQVVVHNDEILKILTENVLLLFQVKLLREMKIQSIRRLQQVMLKYTQRTLRFLVSVRITYLLKL